MSKKTKQQLVDEKLLALAAKHKVPAVDRLTKNHKDVHVDASSDENDSTARDIPTNEENTNEVYVEINIEKNQVVNDEITTHINDNNDDMDVNIDGNVSMGSDNTLNIHALTFDRNIMIQQIRSQKKKKTLFQEQYSRRSVWIRNDLNELLDKELENGGKIAQVVNDALALYYSMKAQGLIHDNENEGK